MLNYAEQTGSGAVIVVWSFLSCLVSSKYTISAFVFVMIDCNLGGQGTGVPGTMYCTWAATHGRSFVNDVPKIPSLQIPDVMNLQCDAIVHLRLSVGNFLN
jgi:hypothetical protein